MPISGERVNSSIGSNDFAAQSRLSALSALWISLLLQLLPEAARPAAAATAASAAAQEDQ